MYSHFVWFERKKERYCYKPTVRCYLRKKKPFVTYKYSSTSVKQGFHKRDLNDKNILSELDNFNRSIQDKKNDNIIS